MKGGNDHFLFKLLEVKADYKKILNSYAIWFQYFHLIIIYIIAIHGPVDPSQVGA